MPLAYLTLITGLAISAVAIYYSVIGLAAIFSAAVIPIIVMGAILEVSKLVAAWWLKANWDRAPILLKSYMLVSVIVLMLITSMGIFGFLSKAHSDQAITTGDVMSQVALYDEQINVERENIANAKSLIAQMDATVQGIIASGESREIKLRDGRTYVRSAAEQALQVRRSQAKDRAALTATIEEAQKSILALQQKKAPIASQAREVEAKVGPIKYIAQLIYGEDPDQNLLEKAVTWVIITIVFVFDPLAVLLLLASQMSFQWARQDKERKDELVQEITTPEDTGKEETSVSQPVVGTTDEGDRGEQSEAEAIPESNEDPIKELDIRCPVCDTELDYADEIGPFCPNPDCTVIDNLNRVEPEVVFIEPKDNLEKRAKTIWKSQDETHSLKRERDLLEKGLIEELPWKKIEEDLKAKPDNSDDDAVKQAMEWAQEQLETQKKETYMIKEDNEQKVKTKDSDYVQNSEQGEETIWKKIQQKKQEDE